MATPPEKWKAEYAMADPASRMSCKGIIDKEVPRLFRLGEMIETIQFDSLRLSEMIEIETTQFDSLKPSWKPVQFLPPLSSCNLSASQDANIEAHSSKFENLGDLNVAIVGLPKESMKEWMSKIEVAGGLFHAKIEKYTNCLVVSGVLDDPDAEIRKARWMKILIVREDYLVDCFKRQRKLPFDLYNVEAIGASSMVTGKNQRQIAVHDASGLEDFDIHEDGKSIYSTTLNMSDVSSGINWAVVSVICSDETPVFQYAKVPGFFCWWRSNITDIPDTLWNQICYYLSALDIENLVHVVRPFRLLMRNSRSLEVHMIMNHCRDNVLFILLSLAVGVSRVSVEDSDVRLYENTDGVSLEVVRRICIEGVEEPCLVGSCCGIALFFDWAKFNFLTHSASGVHFISAHRRPPPCRPPCPPAESNILKFAFGFGVLSSSNIFKILFICYTEEEEVPEFSRDIFPCYPSLYSSSVCLWSGLPRYYYDLSSQCGVSIFEKIYFVTPCGEIVFFSLINDTFGLVSRSLSRIISSRLGVLGQDLCICDVIDDASVRFSLHHHNGEFTVMFQFVPGVSVFSLRPVLYLYGFMILCVADDSYLCWVDRAKGQLNCCGCKFHSQISVFPHSGQR